jgi:hypothetical protein
MKLRINIKFHFWIQWAFMQINFIEREKRNLIIAVMSYAPKIL